jgi:pimeloyl-ACP methyl ester carboxylesterase
VRWGPLPGRMSYTSIGSGIPLCVFPGLSRDNPDADEVALRAEASRYRFLARATGREINVIRRPAGLPRDGSMPEIAKLHAAALSARFGTPVDVLGISTGGAIALQLAVDSPPSVRRLIIAGAASWLGAQGRERLRAYGDAIAQGRTGAGTLSRVLAGPRLWWLLAPVLWVLSRRERSIDPSDMLAMIHAECGFDVTPRLGEIVAPTLIIAGERDHAFRPELFRAAADGIRGSRLVMYPRRGHIGAMWDPRFGRDIASFLATESTGPTAHSLERAQLA